MLSTPTLLPISALQHLVFCERQCALIHLEQQWAENRLTVEGQILHRRADEPSDELIGDTRVVRGLELSCERHGLTGKADVVEFTMAGPSDDEDVSGSAKDVRLPELFAQIRQSPQSWQVRPVEYKRGKPKKDDSDRVQLAAQALCLEEMLRVSIEEAFLFYGQRKRRTVVPLDAALRQRTIAAAARLHELIDNRITPTADRQPKCDACSLFNLCLPHGSGPGRSASRFVARQFASMESSTAPTTDSFESEGQP